MIGVQGFALQHQRTAQFQSHTCLFWVIIKDMAENPHSLINFALLNCGIADQKVAFH